MATKNIIELARLYNTGHDETVEKIEAYLTETAKGLLYPESEFDEKTREARWNARPIEIHVADKSTINAGIFVNQKPPVIAVNKGILTFIANDPTLNEDALCWVLMHELGHDEIRQYIGGPIATTKGEEFLADRLGLEALLKTNRDPNAGINFFRQLEKEINKNGKENVLGSLLQAVFDPHPADGDRIGAMQSRLSDEKLLRKGTLPPVEDHPIHPIVLQPISAKHTSFLGEWLQNYKAADGILAFAKASPAEQLHYVQKGLEASLAKPAAVFQVRENEILDEVKKIVPDGSDAYKTAVDDFVSLATTIAPNNRDDHFMKLYGAVAEAFGKTGDEKYKPLGPFGHLDESLSAFLALDPQNKEAVYKHAEDVLERIEAIQAYYQQVSRRNPYTFQEYYSIKKHLSIVKEIALPSIDEPSTLKKFYPLAKENDSVAKVLWQAGALSDETFWELLGPYRVAPLLFKPLHKESLNINNVRNINYYEGFESFNDTLADVNHLADFRKKATQWLKKQIIASYAAKPPPKTIKEYYHKNFDVLFPKDSSVPSEKGTNAADPLQVLWEGNHPAAEKFAAFVIEKFAATATEDARKALVSELSGFYSECRKWIDEVHGGKENLPEKHPYFQLLLSKELDVDPKQRIYWGQDVILNAKTISLESARQLFDTTKPRSVDDCLTFCSKFTNDDYCFIVPEIEAREIARIFQEKDALSFDDPDLLRLSMLSPDRPPQTFCDQGLLTKEVFDAVSDKLRNVKSGIDTLSLDDTLSLYRFLERNRLFGSFEQRTLLGKGLVDKIEKADPTQKLNACERMLLVAPVTADSDTRDDYIIANLSLRDALADIWQAEIIKAYGMDDGSNAYYEKVGGKVDEIIAHASGRDKQLLLEKLADGLLIQSSLSEKIHHDLKNAFSRDFLLRTHLPIAAAEGVLLCLEKDENLRLSFLDFLSSPSSKESLATMKNAVTGDAKRRRVFFDDLPDSPFIKELREEAKKIFDNLSDFTLINAITGLKLEKTDTLTAKHEAMIEDALHDLHNHFTNLPVEHRTLALSALLIPGDMRLSEEKFKAQYEKSLNFVMDRAFPVHQKNSKEIRSFFSSYLASADEDERALLLAGPLAVSSDVDPTHPSSLPEQAAKVMAAMGPAYVKLGQAINSHPQCPPDWKKATQGLKSSAKTAPRWEIIRRLNTLLPNSVKKRIAFFGPILGSASFNTAIKLLLRQKDGTPVDIVASIERENAQTLADHGFKQLQKTIKQWDAPAFKKYIPTMLEMVDEAWQISKEETDRAVGDAQISFAKELYGQRQIKVREGNKTTTININPVDSPVSVPGVRLLSFAPGTPFADLPETTAEEKDLKKTLAKGYLALELSNILSGKAFDCDRHGRQMNVDVHPDGTVDFNLYDFGCLSLATPSSEQKKALGETITSMVFGTLYGKDPEKIIRRAIASSPDEAQKKYLMRIRKAALALNDFSQYLDSKQDYINVLQSAVAFGIDPVILENTPVSLAFKAIQKLGRTKISFGTQPQQTDPLWSFDFTDEEGADDKETSPVPLAEPETPSSSSKGGSLPLCARVNDLVLA
ncbi:MAG: hypothetical protein PHS57_01580 [Alphaproteobacteria bacterium]|nr:hypothetical protein [Alphaproteobacteria bacterium]